MPSQHQQHLMAKKKWSLIHENIFISKFNFVFKSKVVLISRFFKNPTFPCKIRQNATLDSEYFYGATGLRTVANRIGVNFPATVRWKVSRVGTHAIFDFRHFALEMLSKICY